MSVSASELSQECARCKAALTPGSLACNTCHALVHGAELEQLAASAHHHEEAKEFKAAQNDWLRALELLPPESAQAAWVSANITRLAARVTSGPPADKHAWARRLGPFAPLVILLAKGKFLLGLLKLNFLLSLGSFVALYWALYGAKFGVGFALLILVHEMGHFIDIKRRGLPADMPVFLPGLGAYVRWRALGVSIRTRSFVSLAGPLAGCIGAGVCALLWMQTGEKFWLGLATLSALLNVLNLIPVWVLDGGQAIAALNKAERITLSAMAVLFAALFSQPVFLLVAAGAAYRVFSKDLPTEPSPGVTAYYVGVLAALGFLVELGPPAAFPSSH